jgi:hypothetical protein
VDPLRNLACFCQHCSRLAADAGLDLELVRDYLQLLPAHAVVRGLLGKSDLPDSPLDTFLDFRAASITRTVRTVANQARSYNLSIGLDVFSPSIAHMVGQDLSSLNETADWVKIMSYPRVFGPAGLSFELFGLAEWLNRNGLDEIEALHILSHASRLPFPASIVELGRTGLGSEIITLEIQRSHEIGITNLLVGIALVKMEKIHESRPKQIQADLEASRVADGLVISWDLWLTPLKYLDRIRTLWS